MNHHDHCHMLASGEYSGQIPQVFMPIEEESNIMNMVVQIITLLQCVQNNLPQQMMVLSGGRMYRG